jgi:mono/diheme cytochrome c family protein
MKKTVTILALMAAAASASLAADAKAGQAAYDKSCKNCHGADGTPNANIAKMMKVEMKDLRSAEVQGMSDADIKGIITNGKGKMPASKTVTGGAVDDVVAYVKSMKK